MASPAHGHGFLQPDAAESFCFFLLLFPPIASYLFLDPFPAPLSRSSTSPSFHISFPCVLFSLHPSPFIHLLICFLPKAGADGVKKLSLIRSSPSTSSPCVPASSRLLSLNSAHCLRLFYSSYLLLTPPHFASSRLLLSLSPHFTSSCFRLRPRLLLLSTLFKYLNLLKQHS